MNLNNFTIKAQESIQQAYTIAEGYNQQAIENGHLLKGVIDIASKLYLYFPSYSISYSHFKNFT